MITLYNEYFRFPILEYRLSLDVAAASIVISLIVAAHDRGGWYAYVQAAAEASMVTEPISTLPKPSASGNADRRAMPKHRRCHPIAPRGKRAATEPPPLAESVAKAIPGARYVEIRTGHYMSVQTPDLIFDCIDEFLRSVDA